MKNGAGDFSARVIDSSQAMARTTHNREGNRHVRGEVIVTFGYWIKSDA